MKRLISFDALGAGTYDVLDALYPLKSTPGVRSVELLEATQGSPRYVVLVDVEDDKATAFDERVEASKREYAGYFTIGTDRTFRKVG